MLPDIVRHPPWNPGTTMKHESNGFIFMASPQRSQSQTNRIIAIYDFIFTLSAMSTDLRNKIDHSVIRNRTKVLFWKKRFILG